MNAEAPKQRISKIIHGIRELRKKIETSKNLTSNIDKLQQSAAYMPSKMLHQKEEMVSAMRKKIKEMKKTVREEKEKISNAKQTVQKIAEIRQVKRRAEIWVILCVFFL